MCAVQLSKDLMALNQQRQFRRVEMVQGRGGGEVAERCPARKAHGRPADPHVDHKRLAASFPYLFTLATLVRYSQSVTVSSTP